MRNNSAARTERTCESHEAGQTQPVGQDDQVDGLQAGAWRQLAAVQELQHPMHAGTAGVRYGDLVGGWAGGEQIHVRADELCLWFRRQEVGRMWTAQGRLQGGHRLGNRTNSMKYHRKVTTGLEQ